jgi:hypothetical protein
MQLPRCIEGQAHKQTEDDMKTIGDLMRAIPGAMFHHKLAATRLVSSIVALALMSGVALIALAAPAQAQEVTTQTYSNCAAIPGNLVTNCGFESGATSWTETNTTPQAQDTAASGVNGGNYHNGAKSYMFYQGANDSPWLTDYVAQWSSLSQNISVTPNTTYTLSYFLELAVDINHYAANHSNCFKPNSFYATVSNTTAGTQTFDPMAGFDTGAWVDAEQGWKQFSNTFTTSASATFVKMTFSGQACTQIPWWLDDVLLVPPMPNNSLATTPFANSFTPGYAVKNTVETLTAYITMPISGVVTFKDGSSVINSVPTDTSSGYQATASMNVVLAVGVHTLTAVYTPNDPRQAQPYTSATVTFTVYNTATTTNLTVVPTVAIVRGVTPVTMTAAVNPVTAVGRVQFYALVGNAYAYTKQPLGSAISPIAGLASRVSTLPLGTFAVVAEFSANNPTVFGPSSRTVNVTVI